MMSFLGNKVISTILKVVSLIFMVVLCISMLIPLIWMLYTSFKPTLEYFENCFKLPTKLEFSNFVMAANVLNIEVVSPSRGILMFHFGDMLYVSFIWAIGIPLVSIFYTLIVSYVMAYYKFRFRNTLFNIGILVMTIPIVGNTASSMVVRKALNLYDNLALNIITSPGYCFSGTWFLLFHASWKSISWSYAEAAKIDGAGNYQVMFRIMLPMMIPTFTAIFLLSFLSTWNDYGTFILWLPSYVNLAYGLYLFQNDATNYGAAMPQIMAGFIICMIPTITVYLSSQKLIQSKLNIGGLKG